MNPDPVVPYYRVLLIQELESRSARNPRYSLRSFARDIKLSPQRLSDLVRGRYGLSATQAQTIAEELGLPAQELKRFVMSAEMLHARSALRRKKASAEFAKMSTPVSALSLDSFAVISEWYHYAILELTYVKGFRSDVKWIAQQLDLTEFTVTQAVERLLRLKLLKKNKSGKLEDTEKFLATPSDTPSDALRKFQRQILEKAIQALDMQSVKERDITSIVMAIDKDCLPDAKEDLRKFRREFMTKYSTNQTSVYCLGISFFRLQTAKD